MKKIVLAFLVVLIFLLSSAQDSLHVKWIDFKTLQKLDSLEKRPLLIDIYTDWCGWCKVMDKNTYSNKNIASYINNNFYALKLNSEKDDSIYYRNKLYRLKGKNNELAVELLQGRMAYPSTVFVTKSGSPFVVSGYLSPSEIEPYLVYFAEELENSLSVDDFVIFYKMTYEKFYKQSLEKIPNDKKPDTTGKVTWNTFSKFDSLMNTKKKFLIFAYVPWCNSCKIMKKITFSNPKISKLIKENFNLIEFDAASTEKITINNKTYYSLGPGQPHQLALELFTNQFSFPTIFFYDENFKPILQLRAYATAEFLEVVLNYIITESYQKEQFQTYYQKNIQNTNKQ